jgi:glycosyltransferase involved in cell wall biosynthesis
MHIFADTYGPFRRTAAEGEWEDLRRDFPSRTIEITKATDLPELVRRQEYLFGSAGADLQPLAQTRLATGATFPISATLSSLDAPFLLPLYCITLLLGKPCDAIVVPSRAGVETVRALAESASRLLGTRTGADLQSSLRLVHIPHGVDEEFLSPVDRAAARRLLGLSIDPVVLLYLGRLSDQLKADLEPLLIALRNITAAKREVVLLIAGHDLDGTYSKVIAKRAAELGVRDKVVIVPNFPYFVKPFLYGAADIFVSPVDNIQETFGLAVIEAMAAGLPVVASDWSGYRDLVVNGITGLLIPTLWEATRGNTISVVSAILQPNIRRQMLAETTVVDIRSLSEHLSALIDNVDLRRDMGNRGRERVLNYFTWSAVIKQYEDLWAVQLSEARCDADCRAHSIQDFNSLFGHYASRWLTPDVNVSVSPLAQELSRGSGDAADPSLASFRRLAAQFNGDAVPLQQLVSKGQITLDRAAKWLKKGYLELA